MNASRTRCRRFRWILVPLTAALLAWLAACAAAWAWQEALVFHPRRGGGPDPASRGLPFETVQLVAADGVSLHGWYLPRPSGSACGADILFLHGNAGNVSNRLRTLAAFHRRGHAVLIIDYRGYGLSDGVPGEAGTYLDARAAWDHLTAARGVAPAAIVVYGRSLGGAVAAGLVASLPATARPAAVVLESTFASLRAMAAYRYPVLPARWLLRMKYDTLGRLGQLHAPVLIAHSPDDEVVPYHQAELLHAAAPRGTRLTRLNGPHSRAFRRAGEPYLDTLDNFIGSALTTSGASANLCRRASPRPASSP